MKSYPNDSRGISQSIKFRRG